VKPAGLAASSCVAVALSFVVGCTGTPPTRTLEMTAGPADTSLVIGRIRIYRRGQPLFVGPRERPLVGWIQGPTPLTTVGAHELQRDEHHSVDVENEEGWFEMHLPRGRYGIGLRHYIHIFGTPAVFEVRDVGRRYCVGTLNVDLEGGSSVAVAWAHPFGGIVPQGDLLFGVADECKAAPAPHSTDAELMRLEAPAPSP